MAVAKTLTFKLHQFIHTMSHAIELLVSNITIKEETIKAQMGVSAAKAKKHMSELQRLYNTNEPTVLHLALFSGETNLLDMVARLRKAGLL